MSDTPSSAIGSFVIGFSPIGGLPIPPTPSAPNPWPPTGPTGVTLTIPAYPYQQYADDDNVAPFFMAYNIYAQAYVGWFNNINLPIYTSGSITGSLLDWVALGLYGMIRPALPLGAGTPAQGPFNTFPINSLPFNGYRPGMGASFISTTDDIFKRCLTWAFYKGDGKAFSPRWLKRRINRFLNGVNGTDVPQGCTPNISVRPTGFKKWLITVPQNSIGQVFQAAVRAGYLELPFQIQWAVSLAPLGSDGLLDWSQDGNPLFEVI